MMILKVLGRNDIDNIAVAVDAASARNAMVLSVVIAVVPGSGSGSRVQ